MNENKSNLIINIIIFYLIINVLLNAYGLISSVFNPHLKIGFGMITTILSISLVSSIIYLLFKRNKIGWYLAIGNSILIIILTIINLTTYKVYLSAIGINTFGEFLANKRELSNMLKYLTSSIIFNVVIIFLLLIKNVKNQFLESK